MAFLELRLAGGQAHKFALREGDNILGSGDQAGIRIQDPMLAPLQALIRTEPGAFTIRNLVPDKPIYLNATPVRADQPLRPGDQLILGSTRCIFYDVDLESTREMLEISLCQKRAEATIGPTPEPVPAPASPSVPSVDPQPPITDKDLQTFHHLIVANAADGQPAVLLKEKEVTLGSASDAGIRLHGNGVAPRHAKIIQREHHVVIVDLESPAGVFLNDRRIVRETLKDGDVIRLGDIQFTYRLPLVPPPPAEAAARPTMPAAPANAPPIRSSRVLTWVAAGVIGLVVVGVIVVGGIWGFKQLRSAGREEDSRRQVQELVRQHQWQPLADLLGDKDFPLPLTEKQVLLENAQMEIEASQQAKALRQALAGGDMESALAYYFKIPAASVYRPEARAAVLQRIDADIDRTLSKPALEFSDYTAIITLSEKMLQLDPRSASALAYICLARLGQGELPSAAAAAERLIAAHPEQGEGYLFQALALYRGGEYTGAMDSVSEALRRQPDNIEMLLLRAKLSILLQRLTDARLDLAKVLELDPNNTAARTLFAKLSGQAPPAAPGGADARQYEDLLRRRRAAATVEREDTAIRQLFLQGDAETAKRQLEEKIRRMPQAPDVTHWTALLDAITRIETLYREGDALRASDLPAAISRWEEMRRVETAAFPGQRSRFLNDVAAVAADFFAARALADLQGNQPDRAYDLASQAVAWQPAHAQAQGILRQIDDTAQQLYQEGFRHYQQGDRAGARQYWEKVGRTVTPASPWYARAQEKLSGLQEVP
ncbi:MAG: FHA domain-containing protein [Acidobacteria bacterium]|nr:FHA domain-containing protein [Acidobacteriota bacterium]